MEIDKYSVLIKKLRTRAWRFRSIASFALIGSVFILLIAIYFFLYASSLSFLDNVNLLKLKTIQFEQLSNQRYSLAMELKDAQQRYLD